MIKGRSNLTFPVICFERIGMKILKSEEWKMKKEET